MRIKHLYLLLLSLVFLLGCGTKGAAVDLVLNDLEVVVPTEGLTELDLKSGVCIYQGQLETPVRLLVASPKMQLAATTIIYDREKQLLTANQQAELQAEEAGLQATGEQMEITPETVKLPVGGKITATTEDFLLVCTGVFQYQIPEETVQVTGGFELFHEGWSLKGQQMEGDLPDGFFTARGELSFEHPEVAGEAERIEYDQKNEIITFLGSPYLHWTDGWLQGKEETVIIYYLASGKAKAEGPTKMRVFQDTVVNSDGD